MRIVRNTPAAVSGPPAEEEVDPRKLAEAEADKYFGISEPLDESGLPVSSKPKAAKATEESYLAKQAKAQQQRQVQISPKSLSKYMNIVPDNRINLPTDEALVDEDEWNKEYLKVTSAPDLFEMQCLYDRGALFDEVVGEAGICLHKLSVIAPTAARAVSSGPAERGFFKLIGEWFACHNCDQAPVPFPVWQEFGHPAPSEPMVDDEIPRPPPTEGETDSFGELRRVQANAKNYASSAEYFDALNKAIMSWKACVPFPFLPSLSTLPPFCECLVFARLIEDPACIQLCPYFDHRRVQFRFCARPFCVNIDCHPCQYIKSGCSPPPHLCRHARDASDHL